jgi:hypothetical protein
MEDAEYDWVPFALGLGEDGFWRYAIGDRVSKFAFANKVDAYRYASRPQRLSDDGSFLVPEIRWSPELN